MDQIINENQLGFAFLQEADKPVMAPLDDVASFECETDAINYAIESYSRVNGYSFTQTNLAEQLRMTKQTLSKLRQGDISMPRNRFERFAQVTRSYVLIQFYAMRFGLVLKTREENDRQRAETERLEKENQLLRERYQRAVGQ